jgi:hypothetical protein
MLQCAPKVTEQNVFTRNFLNNDAINKQIRWMKFTNYDDSIHTIFMLIRAVKQDLASELQKISNSRVKKVAEHRCYLDLENDSRSFDTFTLPNTVQ